VPQDPFSGKPHHLCEGARRLSGLQRRPGPHG
jgi:hypothetical protein